MCRYRLYSCCPTNIRHGDGQRFHLALHSKIYVSKAAMRKLRPQQPNFACGRIQKVAQHPEPDKRFARLC